MPPCAMDLAAPYIRLRGPEHSVCLERNGLFRMQDPEPRCNFEPSITDNKAMDDIHAQTQAAFYNRVQWTTQDHRLASEWSALMADHPDHSFPNSVAYWPKWDSTVVFRDDYCTLMLGTQRTALDIPELKAHQVDIIVTLNASSRFRESYDKMPIGSSCTKWRASPTCATISRTCASLGTIKASMMWCQILPRPGSG